MRFIYPVLVCILLYFSSFNLFSQSNNASDANQRVALIIGNSDYDAGPLLNPENDARAMAIALRKTDFEVMEYINLENQADMKRAIREFGKKIQNGGVGLFYYAGHGIQVGGKNYLIPTKAQIYAEEEVEYESVDVGFVLSQMEIARNRMNILILDACRNNPFARSWRSSATGLAFINAPAGTLIAYATAPGSVASDGTGSNGLYTEQLLKQINRPGVKIEDVFKSVRSGVLTQSGNMQTPWESSSLVGDFYFIRPDAVQTETPVEEVFTSLPTAKGLGSTESADRAEWKVVDGKYFFFLNGSETTSNTSATTVDKDVLLYDRSNDRNFLMKEYWNIKDQNLRAAEELFSWDNSFFKVAADNKYWFYLEGKEVSDECNNSAYGNDIIVYHKTDRKYFVLYGFKDALYGELYPASHIFSDNNTLWWSDEKYFYLYVDGVQIAGRIWFTWQGNDIIVHDEVSSSSYLLRDYYNSTDKLLRPSEILIAPEYIYLTHDEENKYYIYRNNEPYYMEGSAAYSNQDLIVFDPESQQMILFKDFLSTASSTRIYGTPLYSRTNAVWRRLENTYYLYIEGALQSGDMVSSVYSSNGRDLEVFQVATGTTFLLKDFAGRNDNLLRPAEIKQ